MENKWMIWILIINTCLALVYFLYRGVWKKEYQMCIRDRAYTVNKTVVNPQDEYRVGDKIQYQIAVNNTGNVTLHNVVVSDNLQGASDSVIFTNAEGYTVEGSKATISEIGIGETVVLNCEYLIVREDAGATISNIASVTTDETGETPREDETEETPVVNIYRLTIHLSLIHI